MKRSVIVIIAVIALGACGGSSPAGPSAVAQVSGAWSVSTTVSTVTGGECFASDFQGLVGTRATGTIQIQQSGAELTATATDTASGSACTYSGTASTGSVALNILSCTGAEVLGATCPNGAGPRNIRLQTGGVNVTASGGTMTGTSFETLAVTTTAGTTVGTATLDFAFSATKR